MTIVQQDNSFRDSIISMTLLEKAINWIQLNMNPEDVFSKDQLATWAHDNGYEIQE